MVIHVAACRPAIAGHVDALAAIDGASVVVEVKATNEVRFERVRLGDGTEGDEAQAMLYAWALRAGYIAEPAKGFDDGSAVVGAVVVYVNRGARRGLRGWVVLPVEIDDDAVTDLIDGYASVAAWVAHHRETGELMPIPEDMAPHRFPCATAGERGTTTWCPHYSTCWRSMRI